jgi:hypothetical protein
MSRDVMSIVEEFLHSDDERVRRNAVAALAALGRQEEEGGLAEHGIEGLVQNALGGPDAEVRRWATHEILELPAQAHAGAVRQLHRALDRPSERARAYALLGLLYSRGTAIDLGRHPWSSRVRIAREAAPVLDPTRAGTFRSDLAAPAMLGGAMGLVLILMLLAKVLRHQVENLDASLILVLLFALAAAPVLAVVSSRRMNPVGLQPDRALALHTELLAALRGTTISAVLLIAAMMLLMPELPTRGRGWMEVAVAVLLVWLLPSIVRFGTLAATGIRLPRGASAADRVPFVAQQKPPARRSGAASEKWFLSQRLLPAMVGAAAGIAFFTLLVPWLEVLLNQQLWQGEAVLRTLWLALLPSCLGLGWAFAELDGRGPTLRRPFLGTGAAPATLLLLAPLAVAVGLLLWQAGAVPEAGIRIVQVPLKANEPHVERSASLPFGLRVRSAPPAELQPAQQLGLHAVVSDPSAALPTVDLVLEVVDESTGASLPSLGRRAEFGSMVDPGTYTVRARVQEPAAAVAADRVLPLLAARLSRSTAQVDSFRLTVEFLSDTVLLENRLHLSDEIERIRWSGPEMVDSAVASVGAAELRMPRAVVTEHRFRLCLLTVEHHPEQAGKVLSACRSAVDADSTHLAYRRASGTAHALAGERDEAIRDLEAFLRLPRSPGVDSLFRRWVDTLRTRSLTVEEVRAARPPEPGYDTTSFIRVPSL